MSTEQDIRVTFAARALAARERSGMSQADLATASGLHPAAVSHFETGERTPSIANLRRLVVALGTSADYLLGLPEPAVERGSEVEQAGALWTGPISLAEQRRLIPPAVYHTVAPGTERCKPCGGWHEPPTCEALVERPRERDTVTIADLDLVERLATVATTRSGVSGAPEAIARLESMGPTLLPRFARALRRSWVKVAHAEVAAEQGGAALQSAILTWLAVPEEDREDMKEAIGDYGMMRDTRSAAVWQAFLGVVEAAEDVDEWQNANGGVK